MLMLMSMTMRVQVLNDVMGRRFGAAVVVAVVGLFGCAEPPPAGRAFPPCGVVTQGLARLSPDIAVRLPVELGGTTCTPGVGCEDELEDGCVGSATAAVGTSQIFAVQVDNPSPIALTIEEATLDGPCADWAITGEPLFRVQADTFGTIDLTVTPSQLGECSTTLRIVSDARNAESNEGVLLVKVSVDVSG